MTIAIERQAGPLAPVRLIKSHPMELILLVLVVFLIWTAPGFATLANVLNVLRTGSMLGIIAFGMTAVIIRRDGLSVGAGAALAGCIVAWFAGALGDTLGYAAAISLGILTAGTIGFVIGVLTGKARQWFNVPTFITTLGLFTALRGVANLITGGFPLATFPSGFDFFGGGYLLGIPFPVYVFLLTFVGMHFLMNFTRFGRSIYAVGGNMEAARLSGIDIWGVKCLALGPDGSPDGSLGNAHCLADRNWHRDHGNRPRAGRDRRSDYRWNLPVRRQGAHLGYARRRAVSGLYLKWHDAARRERVLAARRYVAGSSLAPSC